MVDTVIAGSDVPIGTYRCVACAYRLRTSTQSQLPPCPSCRSPYWRSPRRLRAAQDVSCEADPLLLIMNHAAIRTEDDDLS